MTIVHANDPTTRFLSQLYEQRGDVTAHITEASTKAAVQRAIREGNALMMLGHGNEYGLFSAPNKKGKFERLLISDRDVQFLRDKTCICIWCHANQFAEKYGLHGLFSGMIISELQEAIDYNIVVTKEEIDRVMNAFTRHLKDCIDRYDLKEIPLRMSELDTIRSELSTFNYSHLYYFE